MPIDRGGILRLARQTLRQGILHQFDGGVHVELFHRRRAFLRRKSRHSTGLDAGSAMGAVPVDFRKVSPARRTGFHVEGSR